MILPIPTEAHGHDAWIAKLADAAKVRHLIETPLQYYRRHGENTSSSFASRLGGGSIPHLLWEFGLRDARDAWEGDAAHAERYWERLMARAAQLEELGRRAEAEAAIEAMSRRADALRERIRITSVPRRRRTRLVLDCLGRGGYRSFAP